MFRRSGCCRMLTSYLSDIEGSRDYFNRFLGISKVLFEDGNGRLQLRDNTRFVFGGDAFDKGDGDLEICHRLVDLKERFPDRCTFILGNRDVNKTTFTSHFTPQVLALPADEISIPYFAGHVPKYTEFLTKHGLKHDVVGLMKYRLAHTMGCTETFELRRKELQRTAKAVTDLDVVDSFLSSVRPGGIVRRFLQHGQLMAIIDGVAFVHGAILPSNFGFVPDDALLDRMHPEPPEGRRVSSAAEWCAELNAFASRSLQKWIAQPEMNEDGVRGAHAIGAYGHRKSIHDRTVMVMTYLESGQPDFVDLSVVDGLTAGGVFRVCCGHQPCGDIPLIINQPGLSVITSDSSYCDMKSSGGRGHAVAEVLLDGETGSAVVHGTRADGTPFSFDADDDLVGKPLGDGWWTKALLADGKVLLHRTKDKYFSCEYEVAERAVAEERLWRHMTTRHVAVPGDARPLFTREELVPARVLKSRVTRTPLADGESVHRT
jgi:hypothetical protein